VSGTHWDSARTLLLKELWEKGYSASKCGLEFGVSRNAICGKIFRMGLSVERAKAPPRVPKVAKARTASMTLNQRLWAVREPTKTGEQIVDLPPDQSSFAVPFIKAESWHQCQWPLGEPTHDMMVCGAEQGRNSSYCDRHHVIAYQPYQRRKAPWVELRKLSSLA